MAATVTPASARASPPQRSSSSFGALGEVTHTSVWAAASIGGPAMGSMRITAHSSTSAPRSRRRATSPLACARARVTTMRRPCSGRASAHASSSRKAATAPITVTAGEPIPAASTAPAIVASVPDALRCAAVVPDCVTQTGVSGSLPAAIRVSATAPRRATPMSTTSVPGSVASAAQSTSACAFPGCSCAVTMVT